MTIASLALDLVFPPFCVACDRPVRGGPRLCDACAVSLYPIAAACPSCALPLDGSRSTTCARCRRAPPPLDGAAAAFLFGGELAVALRRLKYRGHTEVARALAPRFSPALAALAELVDVAVPIPLHWRRHGSRGFNHAALLLRRGRAHAGARLPIAATALRRVRSTPPQAGRTARARRQNVAGAFAVPRRQIGALAGRRVLLVDDVMTTGATLFEAARTVRAAGAAQVLAFAVARAEA